MYYKINWTDNVERKTTSMVESSKSLLFLFNKVSYLFLGVIDSWG